MQCKRSGCFLKKCCYWTGPHEGSALPLSLRTSLPAPPPLPHSPPEHLQDWIKLRRMGKPMWKAGGKRRQDIGETGDEKEPRYGYGVEGEECEGGEGPGKALPAATGGTSTVDLTPWTSLCSPEPLCSCCHCACATSTSCLHLCNIPCQHPFNCPPSFYSSHPTLNNPFCASHQNMEIFYRNNRTHFSCS